MGVKSRVALELQSSLSEMLVGLLPAKSSVITELSALGKVWGAGWTTVPALDLTFICD